MFNVKIKVMHSFKYFNVKELFNSCSEKEIIECISNHSIDSLLVLLRVLDDFRDYIACPVVINSSYRDKSHNARVGGVPTSQHLLGEAIDFHVLNLFHNEVCDIFRQFLSKGSYKGVVGQVIFYNTFIHVALATPKHPSIMYYDKRTSKQAR